MGIYFPRGKFEEDSSAAHLLRLYQALRIHVVIFTYITTEQLVFITEVVSQKYINYICYGSRLSKIYKLYLLRK